MKTLLPLALVFVSMPALASNLTLTCHGRTISAGSISGIDLTDDGKISVTSEYGVTKGDFNPATRSFLLDSGHVVAIPKALLSGEVTSAVVGVSTYEYPYESITCSR